MMINASRVSSDLSLGPANNHLTLDISSPSSVIWSDFYIVENAGHWDDLLHGLVTDNPDIMLDCCLWRCMYYQLYHA